MKPTATLTITTRPTGVLLYELRDAERIVWASLGYDSASGRDRVCARLRTWLRAHPYNVVLAQEEQRRA